MRDKNKSFPNLPTYGTIEDFCNAIDEVVKQGHQGYNNYSNRKYKIKKDKECDQYYAEFEDDKSRFYLNSDSKKDAIEEAKGYDAEGLFHPDCEI